ncbi:UNVERIFIED_CONTAM: hypothetical protein Slati_2714300 [Sesamum latifolium]|uniref:Uncharacterized protein n=1 Tax=Sesamum latifolium TaxID=2727402 RepID=A0AAW2W0K9_9LAMI
MDNEVSYGAGRASSTYSFWPLSGINELTAADLVKCGEAVKRLRFEAMWLRSDQCEEVIQTTWNAVGATNPNVEVWEKVKSCRMGLIQWEKTYFGHVKRGIKKLEDQIAQRRKGTFDTAASREVQGLHRRLEEYRSKEKVMW